jgi:hypothetical protein
LRKEKRKLSNEQDDREDEIADMQNQMMKQLQQAAYKDSHFENIFTIKFKII